MDTHADTHPVLSHKRTHGQRAADAITTFAGSWTFIIFFLTFLIGWMALNAIVIVKRWDPYPFILLNLFLSCIAAIQAPIILMSQNREAHRDRLRAEYDFRVNKLAEKEIRELKSDITFLKNELTHARTLIEKKRR